MNLSELKQYIRNEIVNVLNENDEEDMEAISGAEKFKSQGDKLNKIIIDLSQTEKEM